MEKIRCVKIWKKLDAYLEPNIYGALLQKSFTTKSRLLFSQKSFIIDVWQGPQICWFQKSEAVVSKTSARYFPWTFRNIPRKNVDIYKQAI